MDETWTMTELVEQVANRIASLPAPKNGQVRAVPDDRTIRYYGTIGLLDRPVAMRGRTALYGRKHLAQVVAIKRMQTLGRSLAEIQSLWPTMDDDTLGRMAGVQLAPKGRAPARKDFWKPGATPIVSAAPEPAHADAVDEVDEVDVAARGTDAVDADAIDAEAVDTAAVDSDDAPATSAAVSARSRSSAPLELHVPLADNARLAIALPDDITLTPADRAAIRAAAAPLIAELARRQLLTHDHEGGDR